ncbi:MAG: amidohydrolase family protein [Nitrospinota bacterium]
MTEPKDPTDLVVDFHCHMAYYENVTDSYARYLAQMAGMAYEDLVERFGSPEAFLRLLDEYGVDYAVILAETSPISAGISTNEQVIEFCSGSDRLIPFGTVNPYLDHRPARAVRDLAERGAIRGLKLYPNYQYFSPNDATLYPVYAVAEGLGLPIMFHTGSSILPGSRMKYADPLLLDDVAVDFPDLVIIQCHGGRPFWHDRSFVLCRLHENVYIDVAGLPAHRLLRYFPEMERLAGKFLFGSDWPGVPRTIRQNVEAVRTLGLPEEAVRMVLGGNAAHILALPDGTGGSRR